jgi:hypothetical protein
MTRSFKIVSYGPDGLSAEYPFDPGEDGGGEHEDDIRSW